MTQSPPQNLAGNTFNLTDGVDIFSGTTEDDIFVATLGSLNDGDSLTGGAGNDTLQLGSGRTPGGTIGISLESIVFSGIETIMGSTDDDSIGLNGEQLQDVKVIDSGGPQSGFDSLYFRGATIDLTGKTITGFRSINLAENGSTIRVDNLATAKLIFGRNAQDDHLILTQGTLTDADRNQLHAQGIDKITAGGRTTENKAPIVANLDGDLALFVSNTAVRLDTGAAATLTNDDATLSSLGVRVMNRSDAGDAFGIDVSSGGVRLSDGMNLGSIISVEGTDGGWVEIGGITGAGYGQLNIGFNNNAGTTRVQTLLRALTYQSASGELAQSLNIEVRLHDVGGRRSVSTVKVVRPNNSNPTVTVDGVTSFTVKEGTAFSGQLTTSDDIANEVSVSFDGTSPNGGDAGGLFVIEDGRLKLAPGRALDYEALPSGQKSVTVYIKAVDTEGGSATQAITINVTNDVQDDGVGTDGPDVIIGTAASETLTGKLGDDVLWGRDGDDRLFGDDGKDQLHGEAGNDRLYGGSGNDTLWGEKGKDIFVFDTKLGTSSTDRKVNFDMIKDFNVKDDSLHLDNAIFKKLGTKGTADKPAKLSKAFFTIGDKAKDKNDYIVYNNKTGVLSYDADGSGKGKAVEFAQLAKNLKLTEKDFFVV